MKNEKQGHEPLDRDTPDWLMAMKKEDEGYTVPENYFRDLPDEILKKLDDTRKITPLQSRRSPIAIRRVMYWTVAAAASLALAIIFWNEQPAQNEGLVVQEVNLESIAPDEALAYLVDQEGGVGWEELVELDLVTTSDLEYEDELEGLSTDDLLETLEDELLLELL